MNKILTAIVTALLVGSVIASEEDYAQITRIELTAKTADNTFGSVILKGETTQGQEGMSFSALSVTAKGKTVDVPKDVLARISRAAIMTTTVSAEAGYPDKGMGPFLYVCFLGHDGANPCRFRLVFDKDGFKELKKEDHPANRSAAP